MTPSKSYRLRWAAWAAIAAAPLGWIAGGISAAGAMPAIDLALSTTASIARPLYLPGLYIEHAVAASALAAALVLLWPGRARDPRT